MYGIGKKTAWNALAAYPEVTKTLIAITQDPTSLTLESVHMRVLKRWTVLMYSKNCSVNAPTMTDVNRLFCVGLRGLNNPDIVVTDVDPPPPGPTQSGLYYQRLQQSGSGAGSCRWMVARSRSVLQEQTVEVMEAVVWRCSSGGPWRSSGGARREVHGGRLEVLAAGGGKAGSRAAQRMQNGETRNCTAAHFF
ncbi:unnamed protein product [Arctogadus glacialis]